MKRLFFLFAILAPTVLMAQSQRYVLLEHFTQASCGPCATYNPQVNTLLNANENVFCAIKYQTSWPGTDPMHDDNSSEVNARVSYYGVSGVPKSVIDGNYLNDHPSSWSSNMNTINTRAAVPSPFTMMASYFINPNGMMDIEVIVECTQTVSSTSLRLHTVAIERNIYWDTPPGSNGETHFEHVMKKMLPNQNGTIIPSYTAGDKDTFNFSLDLTTLNIYDLSEMGMIAFVQDQSTKEVHQAVYGAPNFPFKYTLTSNDAKTAIVGANSSYTFNYTFSTTNSSMDTYRFSPVSSLPSGWSWSMDINGNTYTSDADISIAANGSQTVSVTINTDGTLNEKATVDLEVFSVNNYPSLYKKAATLTVVGAANTIFINRDGRYNSSFQNALNANGHIQVTIESGEFESIDMSGLTDANVEQVIINTGSVFSNMLTNDQASGLTDYLNGGGDLMFVGQDLGYCFSDVGETNLGVLFNDFCGATYVSDGNDDGLPIDPNPADDFFGSVSSSSLNTASYVLYSDHIGLNSSQANASDILWYSNNSGDPAGVRNWNDTKGWRVVYLPFRLEAVSDAAFRNEVIDAAITFFNAVEVGVFDIQKLDVEVSIFPNPAVSTATIDFSTPIEDELLIRLFDVSGKIVMEGTIPAGTQRHSLNVNDLATGNYSFDFITPEGSAYGGKLAIVR